MSDHSVVIIESPLHAYKSTRPPRQKILARSGKISATVTSINDFDFSCSLARLNSDPQVTIGNIYELIQAPEEFH